MPAVKPRLVILPSGVRADQPAAASVAEGALYFVTDEGVVERNNGTSWDGYSGVADPLTVGTIIGGTGVNDDLHLQATSGVGTSNARVFLDIGDDGNVTAVEVRLDDAGTNGRVGIGTAPALKAVSCPLTIFGVGADIGYMIKASAHSSNPSAYLQLETANDVAAKAGFTFHQQNAQVEWRMHVDGIQESAMNFVANQYGIATSFSALWLSVRGNLSLNENLREPSTGTRCLVLTPGTAPATMDADTALLFARDDAAGITQLCAMNEGGTITQLSGIRPIVLVKKSGTQSLTSGVRTAITFDVEAFDVGPCHDNSTNNTRLTVPTGADGNYFITANVEYASNTAGIRAAELKQNGTTTLAQVITAPVVGDITVVQVIAITQLVAGDYVELNGLQSSGGALNVGNDSSAMSWTRL